MILLDTDIPTLPIMCSIRTAYRIARLQLQRVAPREPSGDGSSRNNADACVGTHSPNHSRGGAHDDTQWHTTRRLLGVLTLDAQIRHHGRSRTRIIPPWNNESPATEPKIPSTNRR